MLINHKERSKHIFSNFLIQDTDITTISSRNIEFSGAEIEIMNDIIYKLNFSNGSSFLDVGCGYGLLTKYLLEELGNFNIKSTLIDLPNIINLIKKNISFNSENTSFLEGYFPEVFDGKLNISFDRILLYSVLHYTNEPYLFIDLLVKLLKPYGKLLLGDLPNINKKGRFLCSENGRSFEATRKGILKSELPNYKNHFDFEHQMKLDDNYYSKINDQFIFDIYKKYSGLGYEVFILPQNNKLPFCFSRLDIVISRYD